MRTRELFKESQGGNLPQKPVDPSGIESTKRTDLDEETINDLMNQLKEDNQLDNPMLFLEAPKDKSKEVEDSLDLIGPNYHTSLMGHGGRRHRMAAIYRLYDDMPVEVHFIFEREKRARHITDKWIQSLTHTKSENGNIVLDLIKRILR